MSRTVVPPCSKDCPRRRVQPNCHNREYCPAWGEFEDAEAERKAEKRKQIKEEKDVNVFIKSSCRRLAKRAGKRG